MPVSEAPLVGIIMGSRSDWETMRHAAETLDELGVPYETRGRLGAPHARPALRVRRDGRVARPAGDHRGRGRGRAPARHDRVEDAPAGARRPGRVEGAAGARLAALDRADARGSPRRDARDRPRRSRQRGAARGRDRRARRTRACGERLAAYPARAQTAVRARCATPPDPEAALHGRWRRDRSSAASAAVSSGACSALAGAPLGVRFRFLDPSPDACAGDVGELAGRRVRRSGSPRPPRRRRRRRHVRVRERPGRGCAAASARSPTPARSSRGRIASSRRSSSAASASRPRASARSRTAACRRS